MKKSVTVQNTILHAMQKGKMTKQFYTNYIQSLCSKQARHFKQQNSIFKNNLPPDHSWTLKFIMNKCSRHLIKANAVRNDLCD